MLFSVSRFYTVGKRGLALVLSCVLHCLTDVAGAIWRWSTKGKSLASYETIRLAMARDGEFKHGEDL